jgi:hypothetical protein
MDHVRSFTIERKLLRSFAEIILQVLQRLVYPKLFVEGESAVNATLTDALSILILS